MPRGSSWRSRTSEDEDACDCDGEVVPGACPGFNDRDEIQACGFCNRFAGDDEAAAAIAAVVGGEVVERHDPDLTEGAYWCVVVRDGEELSADRIREIAEGGSTVAEAGVVVEPKTYDHDARPDDLPEPGDRCKDCGAAVTWVGPSGNDWVHADDAEAWR